MKLSFLKSYLVGAGSTLDVFPDSNFNDELTKIRKLSCTLSAGTHRLPEEQRAILEQIEGYRHLFKAIESFTVSHSSKADRHALEHDWKAIGGDFLNAQKKVRRSANKDDAECWSY